MIFCCLIDWNEAKIIRISEEKSKSFSLKRVLVDIDATSFLKKLKSLIFDGLDYVIRRLENDGIFYKNFTVPVQNFSFWWDYEWARQKHLIVIKCKVKDCLTDCSALGG